MRNSFSFFSKEKILLLFISFLWIFYFLGFGGHYGFDDMEYAQLANGILNGNFPINNHFAYRFTLILPTVLMYGIFGISDFTSLFFILIASSGILYFVYLTCKNFSRISLSVALAITLSFEYYLTYSIKLMPDIHVCLAFIASIYFLYLKQFSIKKNQWNSLGLATSLLYGFLSKGTIVLIIPLLLFFFLRDLLLRKDLLFWIKALFFGILFLAIYSTTIYLISGNYNQRFEAIFANSYLNKCSYDSQSLKILIHRISYNFLDLLKTSDLIIPSATIIAFFLSQLKCGVLKTKTPNHFFGLVFVLLLFSSNFMSISYSSYHPMCLDIRHFLYLYPIAGISLALIFTIKFKLRLLVTVSILIALTYLFFQEVEDFYSFQLPLGLTYISLLNTNFIWKRISLILLLVVLISNSINLIEGANKVNYKMQKQLVQEHLIEKPNQKYIITDPVGARIGNYWNKFDSTKAIFIAYNDFNIKQFNEERHLFLLQNYASRFLSFYDAANYPYPVKASLENSPLYEDNTINLSIYEINEWITPKENGVIIFNTTNRFENTPDIWTNKIETNQEEIVFEGKNSNWVHEYSPTLKLEIDSLNLEGLKKLYIEVELAVYAEEKLEGQLVLNIKNENENVVYESRKIHPFLKSYSSWWNVKTNYTINTPLIPSGSKLLLYVWNSDKKKLIIDDFQIKIIGIQAQ